MPIIIFFIAHWFLSLLCQTVFLHRYASHRMFSLSPLMEKVFMFFTFLIQGSSYLNPRAYAIMHREHHAFSDSPDDPHSPHQHRNVFQMMTYTYNYYSDLVNNPGRSDRFGETAPSWPFLEKLGESWVMRVSFMLAYTAFYIAFAPSAWYFLLLPIHFVMGPTHGAIVNWCGHMYGYVNFRETKDNSRNTLPFDFLALGELFQNNHHRYPRRPNFAVKKFEFDPTYPLLKLMHFLRIIQLRPVAVSSHVESSIQRKDEVGV